MSKRRRQGQGERQAAGQRPKAEGGQQAHGPSPKAQEEARAKTFRWLVIAATVAAIGAVGFGLWTRSRTSAGGSGLPRTRDNILLVTLDTMRADRLGS